MTGQAAGPVPTDLLICSWGIDAAQLAAALRPWTGAARLFLAGMLADDLGGSSGPLEIVAVTERPGEVAQHSFELGSITGCPVTAAVTVLPLDTVRSWSVPLVRLLTGPVVLPPEMPRPVAVGFHALYSHRNLLPGDRYLDAELEQAHAEVLPLYVAAGETRRLRHDADLAGRPAARLPVLLRALLGAWGYCNPSPGTLVPLFERAARRQRLAPELSATVRRAMAVDEGGADVPAAVAHLEKLCAADAVLQFCDSLVGRAATGADAVSVGG
ncbi:hypothetical protein GCM10020358_71410 [Amorphoplanes nipponensis]|uniref:Uncharacterized protein n=1 Tax=Actinoplanes nipponensis TaxID=135950 RepID=A0A919JDB1_9ACTN|nr:hypothetical protein [Actinoplanes nipponensis]GIE47071.1 hypothetical protein Ani05nite_06050 [Actinoplanes nipponensis]